MRQDKRIIFRDYESFIRYLENNEVRLHNTVLIDEAADGKEIQSRGCDREDGAQGDHR